MGWSSWERGSVDQGRMFSPCWWCLCLSYQRRHPSRRFSYSRGDLPNRQFLRRASLEIMFCSGDLIKCIEPRREYPLVWIQVYLFGGETVLYAVFSIFYSLRRSGRSCVTGTIAYFPALSNCWSYETKLRFRFRSWSQRLRLAGSVFPFSLISCGTFCLQSLSALDQPFLLIPRSVHHF